MSESNNAWDDIFAQRGRVFTEPHEELPSIASLLQQRGAKAVLDLGCGTGRHLVYLAQRGFRVSGLDSSPRAIGGAHQWLASEGLDAELHLSSMAEPLPWPDATFDAVLSVQVIHHARLTTIRSIVDEVYRVLKPGGFLFVTVPLLRNQGDTYREIEPNTLVPLDGAEKGLPHHYFTPEELREVFGVFEIEDIHLDQSDHYCLWASKRQA